MEQALATFPWEKLRMQEFPDGTIQACLIAEGKQPQIIPGVGMAMYHLENFRMPLREKPESTKESIRYEPVTEIFFPFHKYPNLTDQDAEWFEKGPGKHKDWIAHCDDNDADAIPKELFSGFGYSGVKERLLAAKKFRILTRMFLQSESVFFHKDDLGQLLQFEETFFHCTDYRDWLAVHKPEIEYSRKGQIEKKIQRISHPWSLVIPNKRMFLESSPGQWREYLEDAKHLQSHTADYSPETYIREILKDDPTPVTAEKTVSLLQQYNRFKEEPNLVTQLKENAKWLTAVTLVCFGKGHISFRKLHVSTNFDTQILNAKVLIGLGRKIDFCGGNPTANRNNLGLSRTYDPEQAKEVWLKADTEVIASGWITQQRTSKFRFEEKDSERVRRIIAAVVEKGNLEELKILVRHNIIPHKNVQDILACLKKKPELLSDFSNWLSQQI